MVGLARTRQCLGSRIEVICGDVCLSRLGLNEAAYGDLAERVTHIIHTAADWRLVSLEELRKTNVQGTANVLELAKEANKHHPLERFSHISTAYVAGARTGTVPEDELTDEFGFFTDYERSKYEGELLVQAAKNEFPVSVFRPSMVVGDSQTGAIKTFNTFYFPLRLYLTGKMRVHARESFPQNQRGSRRLRRKSGSATDFEPKAEGLNFHLVAPYESLPTLGELLDLFRGGQKTIWVQASNPDIHSMSAFIMKTLLKLQRSSRRPNGFRCPYLSGAIL